MADHRGGRDSPGSEEIGKRIFGGQKRWQCAGRGLEAGTCSFHVRGLRQGKRAQLLAEDRLEVRHRFVERLPILRFCLIQLRAHPRVLRTAAWEHEDDGGRTVLLLMLVHQPFLIGRLERGQCVGGVLDDHSATVRQLRAALEERKGLVGEVQLGICAQVCRQILGCAIERGRRPCRQDEQLM